jgi:hypothetical protein
MAPECQLPSISTWFLPHFRKTIKTAAGRKNSGHILPKKERGKIL